MALGCQKFEQHIAQVSTCLTIFSRLCSQFTQFAKALKRTDTCCNQNLAAQQKVQLQKSLLPFNLVVVEQQSQVSILPVKFVASAAKLEAPRHQTSNTGWHLQSSQTHQPDWG